MPNLETTITQQKFFDIDIKAGGPGSGRRKSGITDMEHQSILHMRRSSFKTDHALTKSTGKHTMTMADSKGKTHVMQTSAKGFSHSTINKKGVMTKIGSGSHKQMNNYATNHFAAYHGKM